MEEVNSAELPVLSVWQKSQAGVHFTRDSVESWRWNRSQRCGRSNGVHDRSEALSTLRGPVTLSSCKTAAGVYRRVVTGRDSSSTTH